MNWMDFINGVFEAGLALFLVKGVLKLRVDKAVLGFYWPTVVWTTAWGIWNLAYYPHLDQWCSFTGGLFVVAVNLTWLAHVGWYAKRKTKNAGTLRSPRLPSGRTGRGPRFPKH